MKTVQTKKNRSHSATRAWRPSEPKPKTRSLTIGNHRPAKPKPET